MIADWGKKEFDRTMDNRTILNNEQRATSNEQRATSNEQLTTNIEWAGRCRGV